MQRTKTQENGREIIIVTCCYEEDIRNTFKQLNYKIVYINELNYMLNLYRATAIIMFNKIIAYSNIAIVETIKGYSFMCILRIFAHLGFNIDKH